MSDAERLVITSKSQLFIDDRMVERSEGVRRTVNRPAYAGVAIEPGPPGAWDDAWVGPYGQVMAVDGAFRMYTHGRSVAHINELLAGRKPPTPLGVAESEDGIHWRKPELGQCEYEGTRANNISCRDGGYVFVDPNAPDDGRFKLLVFAHHFIGAKRGPDCLDLNKGGFYILTSPDGLRWDWNGRRVFPFQADTLNQLDWDPAIGRYVGYLRTWPDGFLRGREKAYGRAVGRIELDDPMAPWPYREIPNPFLTAGADGIATLSREVPTVLAYPEYDRPGNWTDVYTPAVMRYPWAEDTYFAFPALNHYFPDSDLRNHSSLDIGMAVSRDGIDWSWPSTEPYLAESENGPDPMLYMLYGALRVGDRIYQYYHGGRIAHGALRRTAPADLPGSGIVYRAVQRLDGFVSADFVASGGRLETKAFVAPGETLHLNVDATRGGGRVGVTDERGVSLPGLGIDDCDPVTADAADCVVTWRGQRAMAGVKGRAIRLVFRMHRAKLYSFRVG